MTETKDKLVDLEDLKVLADDTTTKLGGKLAVPLNEGTEGQVLTAKGDGTSEWKDAQGGGVELVQSPLNKDSLMLKKDGKPVDMFSVLADPTAEHRYGYPLLQLGVNPDKVTPEMGDEQLAILQIDYNANEGGMFFSMSGGEAGGSASIEMSTPLKPGSATNHYSSIICDLISANILGGRTKVFKDENEFSKETACGLVAPFGSDENYEKLPGLVKPDELTVACDNATSALSVKDGGITMSKLAKDVKDAIAGNAPTIDEADVRRIVNEQLAKMKFTINDQGHLIIETPEA